MTDHELQLKAIALHRAVNPLEFEGVGNCGEFAIIKILAAVLIPSNSTGLEMTTGVESRH